MEIRLDKERDIAPLAVLRIAFGLVMLVSTIRFIAKGWVYEFYVAPRVFFPFYGFEWVRPLSAVGMYVVFSLMAAAALFVAIGFFYRVASVVFFVCFVYVELLDKSYYLNHYYFVSIISFLLLFVPAHRYWSVDVLRRPGLRVTKVPAWTVDIFRLQLLLVYFFAGISKLNADWLFEAEPLRIWLPANGGLFRESWIAYAMSWGGACFDLSIGFLLWWGRTRRMAYVFVVIFHVVTGWLFKIGMFPYIMIAVTLVFFEPKSRGERVGLRMRVPGVLYLYFMVQVLLPFRYLLYPGKLYWTEEGYRFSWRVMLMEKGGTAFFYLRDGRTGRRWEVENGKFLTPLQERMMQTQPDMILQYAHYLHDHYQKKGISDPIITVEDYVTLNGRGSRLYIDSTVDLAKQQESFLPKRWILPYE